MAGTAVARADVARITSATTAYVTVSCVVVWNSIPEIARPAAIAPTAPSAIPSPTIVRPERITVETMLRAWAPSATRTPISCVR